MELVSLYELVACDNRLLPQKKKQYFHKFLRGYAKRFYLDRVENYVTTFQQAVEMIEKEYSSKAYQNRVKNYLNGLRMAHFTSEGLDEPSAMEKVYKPVTTLDLQVPEYHRGPVNQVQFLLNATVGLRWAT